MMISRYRIIILLLVVFLCTGSALAASPMDYVKAPLKLVTSPVNFLKKMLKKDKKEKKSASIVFSEDETDEDAKHKHFELGYLLFSEENYQDAAVELYRFISVSSPDEEDYEWAQFFFGISLNELNYSHAAMDVLGNLVTRKPNPKIVSYCFEIIEKNVNTLPHDEEFIVDQVVGDQDYDFVEGDVADFVHYLQGVYDWEHNFFDWGDDHFKKISKKSTYYYQYIYRQALYSVYRDDVDEAVAYLNSILKSDYPSRNLKDKCRKTLARLLYEKGQYDEADLIYSRIEKDIIEQAENLLERAWVHYRLGHTRRAMGLLYSFQAPSFKNAFRPEYFILKSFIYKDVCHYQNALAVVNEFRGRYGDALSKLYERSLPQENNALMLVLLNKTQIADTYNFLYLLEKEMAACEDIPDEGLRNYMRDLYELQMEESREKLRKQITEGYEAIANDLLMYEEDAHLMEYEIGIDMYQRVYQAHYTEEPTKKEKAEKGLAAYEFQGEFWNDELVSYEVDLPNKCENMEEWDVFFK